MTNLDDGLPSQEAAGPSGGSLRRLHEWQSPPDGDDAATGDPDGRAVTALRRENHNLREALATQPVIDQAKGALMLRYGFDSDRAFAVLVRLSQHTNTKLRDIADAVVKAAVAGEHAYQDPAIAEEIARLLGREGPAQPS